MNTLFLINSLKFGGAERVFVKTVNALYEEGSSVYAAFLLGNKDDEGFGTELRVPLASRLYVSARGFYDIVALLRLKKFVKDNNIKVIYSTLDESNLAARLLKIISTDTRIIIREANIADPKPLKFKFLDVLLNLCASKIVCVSEEVKTSLLKYLPFYRSKMVVLPNGIEVPAESKQYESLEGVVRILNVGSLTPKKGQNFLLKGCARVEKERPNSFSLSIVGGGIEKENLITLAREGGIEEKVSFLGKLSSQQVSEQYLKADIFILSSLWEGSPNVLLEAMAHGLVCISTEVSGAQGMIQNGISGFLVQKGDDVLLADKIVEVINKRKSFPEVGLAARKRIIDQFSFPVYTTRLKSILGLS